MITPPILVVLDNHAIYLSVASAARDYEPWQLDNLFAIDSTGAILQFYEDGHCTGLRKLQPEVSNKIILADILSGLLMASGFPQQEIDQLDFDELLHVALQFAEK